MRSLPVPMLPLPIRIASVAVLVLMLSACARSDPDTVVVGAAASLTDAFEEIAAAFESTHPGVDVELNFAGSSALREQILDGSPVDVFASANLDTMQAVVDAGRVSEAGAQEFTTNELTIVVPPGNPGRVTGLEDFARPELLIGLCAIEVPCGGFAREVFASAGIAPVVDTEEPDVRALLTKVAAGELDAGIVYLTDSHGADVEPISIPDRNNIVARYAIAALDGSADASAEFVRFVMSAHGQEILATHGFGGR